MTQGKFIENLRHGADVFGKEGEKLGALYAIVLDPRDNQVTHLGVNAGPHFPEPGFGDPKIINVEIAALLDADEERVDLSLTKDQFEALPVYQHTHFFGVPDAPPPPDPPETGGLPARLWNTGLAIAASLSTLGTGLAVPAEHFEKASFERHILNDAPVWRVEPNIELGQVEQVLVDENDHIAGLVIREGGIFRQQVVIPIKYVTEIRDGVINVHLSDEELESLEEYRP